MAPLPRNRRAGRNTDKSTPKPKGKEKEAGEGFRWLFHLAVAILAAIAFAWIVHYYHANRRTYPANLKTAVCLSDDPSPFFVPCKDRELHNKQILQYVLESASDLSDESVASSSVTYMMALAMRSQDTELGQELFGWMMVVLRNVKCTRLISLDHIDFQKETPRTICAEAKYRKPEATNHATALDDFNLFYDLTFLMSMYGSEFHESAIRFTTEVQLEWKGEPKSSPPFAGLVHSFYTGPNAPSSPKGDILIEFTEPKGRVTPYGHLLQQLANLRNHIKESRQGVHILSIELLKTMTVMRRCNPPVNITWMEYHSRAAFKSAYYEGTDDECGWADANDSFWELVKLAFYDFHFRFRWFMGKI